MARRVSNKVDKAYELFKEGYKLKAISKELDISYVTVWKWKKLYDWDKESLNKEIYSENPKKEIPKDLIIQEVNEVLENEALTNKQKHFCILYSKCFNATKAYQKVYNSSYKTAMVCGSRLLGNPKIKEQINSLTQLEFNKELLKRGILQKYIDIAFADITEFVQFGEEEVQLYDKAGKPKYNEDGALMKKKYTYIKLGEFSKVDGTLISEISDSTSGIKFKLYDKMKALDFLTKHCNLLDDETKCKLEAENKKLQNEKLKAEISKINADDYEEVEDDKFLEALKYKANEVWKDE